LIYGSVKIVSRPFGKHIDNEELDALVPSPSETGRDVYRLSPDVVNEARRHVASCVDCSRKVRKYGLLVNRFSNVAAEAAPPGVDCPKDVDWCEVVAGLWPELKARQLTRHAALCDHCGPLLRAATRLRYDPKPQDELQAESKVPSSSDRGWRFPFWQSMKWLSPALALLVIVGVLSKRPTPSPQLSGSKFAEFAVRTHRRHEQGSLALDIRSDSQQALNEWFKGKAPFSVALPASPAAPGEERPYRLEGARLVQVDGNTAAFIAYHVQMSKLPTARMQMAPASLIVAPDSLAVASGGVEADFKKIRFHYSMVGGYRVVTWSVHGLTYALVSQEDNGTQRSCMVCHSAMRDRNLSHTPTPLNAGSSTVQLFLQ
jgi:hypothetical protein